MFCAEFYPSKIILNLDKTMILNFKIFKHMNLIRDCTILRGLRRTETALAITSGHNCEKGDLN